MFLVPQANDYESLLTIFEPFFNSYQKFSPVNSNQLNKSYIVKVKTHLQASLILLIFFMKIKLRLLHISNYIQTLYQ
ncbi:hypothetical protein CV014_05980 [Nostoc sp. CMAA1605]|nr:hypothetical protein [Nostoc sp. CMAA1605]